MQSEMQKLKSIFDSNNVPISIEFLQDCVKWCRDQILGSDYSFVQLKNEVHNQWLSLDLREIEISVLPHALSDKKKMVLNGSYSLQVMQAVDISKPKYWQLQQIRKENILTRPGQNDNIGTGKRVLQLTLTDGVQYVEAIEYKQILKLNLNITPGSKIRLSGPVTIRRGRLMLEDHNINILGGEVDNLCVVNAPENVLARALKLPENPNPEVVNVNMLTIEEEPESINGRGEFYSLVDRNITNSSLQNQNRNISRLLKTRNPQNQSSSRQEGFPTDNDLETIEQNFHYCEKNKNILKSHKSFVEPTEEEIEMLMEVEREFENNMESNKRIITKTPDLFEDDFDPEQIDGFLQMTNKINEKKLKLALNLDEPSYKDMNHRESSQEKNLLEASVTAKKTGNLDEFFNEDDLFNNIDVDKLESIESNKSELVSIKTILQNSKNAKFGFFKVHCRFKSVEEKLTIKDNLYQLVIMVEDQSAKIICQVHNDVVSKWAGFTPEEIIALRTNILSQDGTSKRKVEKALQNIKNQLTEIDHVIEIELNNKHSVPIIKQIFEKF